MSVREAAERLNRYLEDRVVTAADYEDCEGDIQYVANAYLAEHPADEDELIDEAWLRGLSDTPSSRAFAVCFRGIDGVAFSVMRYRDGFAVYAEDVLIRYVKTRGQLRKLLEALGIETKENKGE